MAHISDDVRIVPDAPGGWTGSPGAGAMSDFLELVNALLRASAEPSYKYLDRRDNPEISVGGANILPFPTFQGIELPDMGSTEEPASILPEVAVVPSLDWKDSPFALPGVTESGVRYMERQAAAAAGLVGPIPPPALDIPPPLTLNQPENDMSFWDDLGDFGIELIRAEFGPDNPPYNQPGNNLPVPQSGGGMVPPTGLPPVNCSTSGGPFPVLKMVCGQYKWVYPKRKRRRALLTESDYNALLRVQNLKVNQNMTVAIAKALTR